MKTLSTTNTFRVEIDGEVFESTNMSMVILQTIAAKESGQNVRLFVVTTSEVSLEEEAQ